MNPAHLHLLSNHLPIVGIPLLGLLLAIGVWRNQPAVQRAALWLLLGLALITIAVYLSGEPAEELVEQLAGVSESAIERHEDLALVAFIGVELLGALALGLLVLSRGGRPMSRALGGGAVVVALIASSLLGWTAWLGGHIRHSEIRAEAAAADAQGERGADDDRNDGVKP